MRKRYWLTRFIQEPENPKGVIAKGVEIIEAANIPGQTTDIVCGFDQARLGGHIGKRCVLMTWATPETEAALVSAGLVPLGRSRKKLLQLRSRIPAAYRFLLNKIDESYPNLLEEDVE